MIEFTPWTFEGRAEPTRFLKETGKDTTISLTFIQGHGRFFGRLQTGFHVIPAESFESFTQLVDASPFRLNGFVVCSSGLAGQHETGGSRFRP